jgi:hypothetical protein
MEGAFSSEMSATQPISTWSQNPKAGSILTMNHCDCLKSVRFITFLITVPQMVNSKAIKYKYNNFVTVSTILEVHDVLHAHHWRLAHASV